MTNPNCTYSDLTYFDKAFLAYKELSECRNGQVVFICEAVRIRVILTTLALQTLNGLVSVTNDYPQGGKSNSPRACLIL